MSTSRPAPMPTCLVPRQPGVQYFIEHHGRHIYVMTNASCEALRTHSRITQNNAQRGNPAGSLDSYAAGYRMGPGDQAEDISFSRWSASDWEAADGRADRPIIPTPLRWAREGYRPGSGDKAEDISFSRWSPLDWESRHVTSTASIGRLRGSPAASLKPAKSDSAEDISFSRWSPVDWEAGGSPTMAGSSSSSSSGSSSHGRQRQPAAEYQLGSCDRAEDISFSRWSPVDWGADTSMAGAGNSEQMSQRLPMNLYRAGVGDRAEDIGFSRRSPADWGAADSLPTRQDRPVEQSPGSGYCECSADRAEDIGFSRWSPIDWGAADTLPTCQNRPVERSPEPGYPECSADRAEDISFSRWSPTDWGAETAASNEGGVFGGGGEYRLLRIPVTGGKADR